MNRSALAWVGFIIARLTAPAYAEVTPHPAGYDPHVQLVAYNRLNLVRVIGSPTNSTQIIFGQGEEITQVAIGDADAWLAQPVGNLLFIKPTEVRMPTNMQVVAKQRDGSSRSYQFSLVAARRAPNGASRAMYAVSFTYPEDEQNARSTNTARKAVIATERAAMARLAKSWEEGPRNWRYIAQGSESIEPTEVSDNGRQTAFRFPGAMRLPTIYTAAPDGTETIVPSTMVGDMAVVQTTARIFILRDGREVLRIFNKGFDPIGRNPGTGTGTTDLSRTLRGHGL